MTEDLWLWIGAILLLSTGLIIMVAGGTKTAAQSASTSIHAGVCVVAAIAYALMATGAGRIETAGGSVLVIRYIDWSITTPLLLIALSVTATPTGRSVPGLIAALVFADVAMLVTGVLAAVSTGVSAWLWFLTSSAAFAVVLLIIWGPLREVAETGMPVRRELYVRHASILTALWSVYPLVFLFGAEGPAATSVMGVAATTALFAILDLTSKAGYGILVTREDDRLVAYEGVERGFPPAKVQLASAMADAAPAHEGLQEPTSDVRLEGSDERDAQLRRTYAQLQASRQAPGRPLSAAEAVAWMKARGLDVRRFAATLPAGTLFRMETRERSKARTPARPAVTVTKPQPRRTETTPKPVMPSRRRPPDHAPAQRHEARARRQREAEATQGLKSNDVLPVAITAAALFVIAWSRDRDR